MDMVYKLVRDVEWAKAQKEGVFGGSPDDLRDGFLHFSAAHQLRATAEKHFAGEAGLVLLTVNPAAVGEKLRWEVSRGGEKFPHFYGALKLDAILRVDHLTRDARGRLLFPREIP